MDQFLLAVNGNLPIHFWSFCSTSSRPIFFILLMILCSYVRIDEKRLEFARVGVPLTAMNVLVYWSLL